VQTNEIGHKNSD